MTASLVLRQGLILHLLLGSAIAVQLARGIISPILHEQALSHLAFHSPSLKHALAAFFPASKTVAIVGVEWGEEVKLFAENGYHVYAFEPASKFVRHLEDLIARNPSWNVTVVPIAAGNASASGTYVDLEYDNENVKEAVLMGTVDEYVRETLAVFSLDIQGDELHVLQGSKRTMSKDVGVLSVWVEAIACNDKVRDVLQMLDESYVLFDFVPWGRHVEQSSDEVPRDLRSFAFDPQRPGQLHAYLSWMCEEKKQRYTWLQTDFLAVRRDVLTGTLEENLQKLADTYCGSRSGQANCTLRNLLLADFEKDEL